MSIEVGAIYEGRVTGITSFGAFVSLPERHSGLVHISEIANTYVSDINQFLKIGQDVKVRVLSMSDDGKINLSIKKAQMPAEETEKEPERPDKNFRREPRLTGYSQRGNSDAGEHQGISDHQEASLPGGNEEFEARLKKFMQESDSRIADNRIYADHRQRNRRR